MSTTISSLTRSVRKRESQPVVERFFAWCDEEAERILDETPISKAIGYARNQRQALSRFLDDERLPIHNNAFVSLLASCQLHGVEPWSYLRDLLCLLPGWPVHRVLELAPINWEQTRQQEETQLLLASNVFRRAMLDPPDRHRELK